MMKPFWFTNFLLFQASWFSAAFYTQHAAWLISGFLLVHFLLSQNKWADLKLFPLALFGACLDKLHLFIGTFSNSVPFTPIDTFFPLWLILLWLMFVVTLNHSLSWLINKSLPIVIGFGACGGTLSYWAGIQAGALSYSWPITLLIPTLILSWGILFPLLVFGVRYLSPISDLKLLR
ncbi:DUF2878 domain-containing protein [Vibrio sp. S4M6]|uniref:DUF2878 domain-containing protein n=1 Tax=Vibrio sinus TaxID=2946865 RepID=UPI002029BBF1|nr:DUF2878 domain-containing protein [Vibrio sinus]MCL9782370.1 DUF2878 domain-containing protein [Vibrio sinus]